MPMATSNRTEFSVTEETVFNEEYSRRGSILWKKSHVFGVPQTTC